MLREVSFLISLSRPCKGGSLKRSSEKGTSPMPGMRGSSTPGRGLQEMQHDLIWPSAALWKQGTSQKRRSSRFALTIRSDYG